MNDTPVPVSTRRSTFASIALWARDLSLSIIIAMVVILFLYQPVQVEGTSMEPTLNDQERIFINKYVYSLGIGEIQRGEMVVFRYPHDPTKLYIKRVIGRPGDVVEIERGTVLVNREKLDETYIPPEFRDQVSYPPTVIKPDEYFVMGDHRVSSADSRTWGPVPREYLYGRAVLAYWPPDKMGLLN